MRYLDTSNRSVDQALYAWLSDALNAATYFGCQAGYFNANGLFPFERQLEAMLNAGGELHLVVGANEDSLTSADLEYVLDLQEPHGERATLVVVSSADVLMHAKTYFVEQPGGRQKAFVGSSNLTPAGLVANIETGLAIDSTDDPHAPFAAIRSSIDAWRNGQHANGYRVNRANLSELIAAGVLDRPRPIRPRGKTSRRGQRLFPPLGALAKLPRRPRARPTTRRGGVAAAPIARISGAPEALPAGMVGIVKQLSRLDAKGFRGERGTPYVALPLTLLRHFPTKPSGKNGEPRFDVPIVARLDSAPDDHVASDAAPTNITGVGMGIVAASNRDLRFNILRAIVSGIESVADRRSVRVPQEGDYVVIEFPVDAPEMRLTFVTEEALSRRVSALVTEARGRWGWLPDGFAPAW